MGVAMGMIVTGWAGGYLLVSVFSSALVLTLKLLYIVKAITDMIIGGAHSRISPRSIWRPTQHTESVSPCHLLCREYGIGRSWIGGDRKTKDRPDNVQEAVGGH